MPAARRLLLLSYRGLVASAAAWRRQQHCPTSKHAQQAGFVTLSSILQSLSGRAHLVARVTGASRVDAQNRLAKFSHTDMEKL